MNIIGTVYRVLRYASRPAFLTPTPILSVRGASLSRRFGAKQRRDKPVGEWQAIDVHGRRGQCGSQEKFCDYGFRQFFSFFFKKKTRVYRTPDPEIKGASEKCRITERLTGRHLPKSQAMHSIIDVGDRDVTADRKRTTQGARRVRHAVRWTVGRACVRAGAQVPVAVDRRGRSE